MPLPESDHSVIGSVVAAMIWVSLVCHRAVERADIGAKRKRFKISRVSQLKFTFHGIRHSTVTGPATYTACRITLFKSRGSTWVRRPGTLEELTAVANLYGYYY